MANQGADRRTVLEMLAKAAVASQFPGFSRWAFAQQHEHMAAADPPPRTATYKPAFFSAHEFRTIDILTGLILPADESPGAQEAGVSEFIDFMAAHGETAIQQPMRDGLAKLDAMARSTGGSDFAELPAAQQTGILNQIALRDAPGRPFFLLIRRYTVMGYYTSAIGMKELDFPGLRLYTESPACPHTNDPEHLHLPPPKY